MLLLLLAGASFKACSVVDVVVSSVVTFVVGIVRC